MPARSAITKDVYTAAYKMGKSVYQGNIQLTIAIQNLVDELQVNKSSAQELIRNLQHMLRGESYKRTLNYDTTAYYLEMIQKEFGTSEFDLSSRPLST